MSRTKEFIIGMIGIFFIILSYHIPKIYNYVLLFIGGFIVGWALNHEEKT